MRKISFWAIPVIMGFLIGCSSSDETVNTDYSGLKKASIKDAPLTTTSIGEFERFLKNGIRLRLVQQDYPSALASPPEDQSGGISGQFSTTNTHELNVDEADRIKYNGEYLFQVVEGGYSDEGEVDNAVRILRTDANNATLEEIASLLNESQDLDFTELYLRDEASQLVAIKQTIFTHWGAFLTDSDWLWQSGKAEIQLYDIQQPEQPTQTWNIEIEGNLEGTRRIGNMLYLVTRYVPNIQDINYSAQNQQDKIINERLILDTPVSDLLPHYQVNDGAVRPLVNASDCFVAEGGDITEGYADVITISAINLDSQELAGSTCLNANVSGIYASTNSLYIGGSDYASWFEHSQFTVVHKFSLSDGQVNYKASKAVPGYLGWSDPAFRMSEHLGNLRIMTTSYSNFGGEPTHQLSILTEDGSNQLSQISQLPNAENLEPIGKPGEELFAVRFAGNKGYAVTFEQIDPLYVLDLSDPESPYIAGELEMPGFSRYLHALSEDWLLGIGNQVVDGIQQGVKVELYDIRDISNPKVQDTVLIGELGSFSEANNDLRAVSFVNYSDLVQRFSLPVISYSQVDEQAYPKWSDSSLHQFELISDLENEMTLSVVGKMTAEQADENTNWPQVYYGQRAVLHNNAVFYLYGDEFCTGFWGATDSTSCGY
jgi:uncharacterized secreted protein with C-terminal beta-propeller domain